MKITDYIAQHEDTSQIAVDVARSLYNYNISYSMKLNKIKELRKNLNDVLLGLVCYDSSVNYYQVLLLLLLLLFE